VLKELLLEHGADLVWASERRLDAATRTTGPGGRWRTPGHWCRRSPDAAISPGLHFSVEASRARCGLLSVLCGPKE